MGLIGLFIWNLCEIRRYVAKQHRLLLRNNTSGSFPRHVPYDSNGAESTTSDNEDGVVGHYSITSAVTSSSSFNGNGTHDQRVNEGEDFKVSLPQHEIFGTPQASTKPDFPFLLVDSPDFNALVASLDPDDIVQDTDHARYVGTESFDTTFVNDLTFTNNDRTHQSADTFIGADSGAMYENSATITPTDEEFSIPSATTAFDVLSVGNISLEQSMSSSVMK